MATKNPTKQKSLPAVAITATKQLSLKRKKELDKFFGGLRALEDFSSGKSIQISPRVFNGDFMKILKASSFLLLYNYIEGCVLQSFSSVYEDIQIAQIPYEELRAEFREIWMDYQSKNLLLDPDASHKSYNALTAKIVKGILEKRGIELSRNALPFSGNLNDEKIKTVCAKHGIKLSSKLAAVEETLETVMSKRNALAHGNISFEECGREYVVGDLERMKDSALQYIDLVLNGIENFSTSKRYLHQQS